MTICFCLLHYRNAEVTKRCVDSIISTTEIDDYKIVIVDNASNNGSYEELTGYYKDQDKIDLLHNKENVGFSRGNNMGYIYAKEKYNPRFILIGNNDLVFKQKNFVSQLIEYNNLYQFDVAGPDILDGDGNHQNPFRREPCSLKRINELNRNKEIMLFLLRIKKGLPLLRNVGWPENWYFSRGKNARKNNGLRVEEKDVVLQGSCLIFSAKFILDNAIAFQEYTFMYMEEDILSLYCKEKGYISYYLPGLKVFHEEMKSTGCGSELERNIFYFSESLKAGRVYKELLKKNM